MKEYFVEKPMPHLGKDMYSCIPIPNEIVAEIKADAIEEYKVKCQQKFEELQFRTGRAWFDFDAGIDRCIEIAEQLL